jgi:hypothetical protein
MACLQRCVVGWPRSTQPNTSPGGTSRRAKALTLRPMQCRHEQEYRKQELCVSPSLPSRNIVESEKSSDTIKQDPSSRATITSTPMSTQPSRASSELSMINFRCVEEACLPAAAFACNDPLCTLPGFAAFQHDRIASVLRVRRARCQPKTDPLTTLKRRGERSGPQQ